MPSKSITVLFLAAMTVLLLPRCLAALESKSGNVDAFVHEGLPFFASRIAPQTVRALPGFQREVVTKEQDEINSSQQNANRVFELRGLKVWLICAPAASTDCLLSSVTLSAPGRPTKFGLSVGSPVAKLQDVFGPANSRQGNEWFYDAESSSVSFLLQNGLVKEIRWHMYIG